MNNYGLIKIELRQILTSWGGTSNDIVLRSTFTNVSIHGMMKNKPKMLNNYITFIQMMQPRKI